MEKRKPNNAEKKAMIDAFAHATKGPKKRRVPGIICLVLAIIITICVLFMALMGDFELNYAFAAVAMWIGWYVLTPHRKQMRDTFSLLLGDEATFLTDVRVYDAEQDNGRYAITIADNNNVVFGTRFASKEPLFAYPYGVVLDIGVTQEQILFLLEHIDQKPWVKYRMCTEVQV